MNLSLCRAIAGTLRKSDFDRFENEMGDTAVADLLPKTASVMECLVHLTSGPLVDVERMSKLASELAELQECDVLQVRPTQYGYLLKYASAPEGTKPKEKRVTAQEAKRSVPKEVLDTADEQGAATVTSVEAQPDPLEETPAPVEGFGMYKVFEAGTGQQMVGFVLPGLLDPRTGSIDPQRLFTNGGQFALQPAISGVLIGVSFNLPGGEQEPRGLGLFYKSDGRGIIATVPFSVISKVRVEGRTYYSAQDAMGAEVQIVPSEGLARPVATSPQEIVIPSDYNWLPLDNEIQLEGGGGDVMRATKTAAASTMVEIRAWRDEEGGGGCDLSGPVFEKNGAGTYDWADGAFWLAAAGMPQNVSVACMDKAASSGKPVRMYGLQPLNPTPRHIKEAAAAAMAGLVGVQVPGSHNLFREAIAIGHDKEARAVVGADSVDSILAINFINPENLETFVEHLPALEESASKLAELVLATQLGLQGVSKTAVMRAMSSLETVIEGLKGLKTYAM